jgi:acyl carrier protein
MTQDEIRAVILRALSSVAPELDLTSIDPHANLRDQFDLDSVDFQNFIVAIHANTGIDIPERDYSKLATLDQSVRYLEASLTDRGA